MLDGMCRRLTVSGHVAIVQSSLATVPMVNGWLRQVILFPVSTITVLTPAQLRAVIAHELAHVARYDYLVNLVQVVLESLMFYHPAVWWMSHSTRKKSTR